MRKKLNKGFKLFYEYLELDPKKRETIRLEVIRLA